MPKNMATSLIPSGPWGASTVCLHVIAESSEPRMAVKILAYRVFPVVKCLC